MEEPMVLDSEPSSSSSTAQATSLSDEAFEQNQVAKAHYPFSKVLCKLCKKVMNHNFTEHHVYFHLAKDKRLHRFTCSLCNFKGIRIFNMTGHGEKIHGKADCGNDHTEEIKGQYEKVFRQCFEISPSEAAKVEPSRVKKEIKPIPEIEPNMKEKSTENDIEISTKFAGRQNDIFQCTLCKKTELRSNAQQHVTNHLAKTMNLTRYRCSFCDNKTFASLRGANRHGLHKHKNMDGVVDFGPKIADGFKKMFEKCTGYSLNWKTCLNNEKSLPEVVEYNASLSSCSLVGKTTERNTTQFRAKKPVVMTEERVFLLKKKEEEENIKRNLMMLDNFFEATSSTENEQQPVPEVEMVPNFENNNNNNNDGTTVDMMIQPCNVSMVPKAEDLIVTGVDERKVFENDPPKGQFREEECTASGSNNDPIDDFSPYYVSDEWGNEDLYRNMAIVAGKMGRTQKQINAIINVVRKNELSVVSLLFEDENLSAFFGEHKQPILVRQEIIKILTAMRFQGAKDS